MLETITVHVSQYWAWSTFLGTILFNENAILTAFSLAVGQGWTRFLLVAMLTFAGVLTNDLILFVVAKYGMGRFLSGRVSPTEGEATKTLFEKVFLHNIFLTLLFIKFIFGLRILLTLFILTKTRTPFWKFLVYDGCGIGLYILILATIGGFIGQGMADLTGTYRVITYVLASVLGVTLFLHGPFFLFRKILERSVSGFQERIS